ncbi:MAG: PAS domain S-box protein [Pseudomonadota bacterium]|nr:MAG: PAS domain S-box protein [Pseudomonadota bacterium]
MLRSEVFQVVLIQFPRIDASELDALMEFTAAHPALPVVVTGDADDSDLALKVVQHGAQDYFAHKHMDSRALARVLRYAIERKRTDAALRASEARVGLLLDSVGEGMFGVDLDGKCTFVNPACLRMLGYASSIDLLGKFMHALTHHTRADGTPCPEEECRIYRTFREGRGCHVDNEIMWHADGTSFPVEYRSSPILVSGVVTGAVVAFSDITERKAAEDALRQARDELEQRVVERTAHLEQLNRQLQQEIHQRQQAEHTLRRERDFSTAILDTVGSLVVVLDRDGRIIGFNQACEQTTGYRFDEMQGSTVWDRLILPEEAEPVKKVFRTLTAGHYPNSHENYWVTRSGERRLISWANTVLVDENGEVEHIIATGIDVTDQRRAEEKERQRMLELAHVSRLSTMGEMATEIAHELNQPLGAIATYSDAGAQLLSSQPPDYNTVSTTLQAIARQARRAGDIVRGLRDFVGKDEGRPTPTDINALVRDVVNLAGVAVRSRSVRIEMYLADGLPQLTIEKILVEQVIFNLVHNAVEAMEQVEPDRRVLNIATAHAADNMIEVSVTDSGPGLPPDQGERVFEAFVSTKANGMGMGLTISRSIVEAHGGRLWATPNSPTGTCFRFTLAPSNAKK